MNSYGYADILRDGDPTREVLITWPAASHPVSVDNKLIVQRKVGLRQHMTEARS